METVSARVPTAKYTKMGETLRHVIPGHMQCSMTCGGKACKYENPSRWRDEEQAIKGLYSSWITDNLLAMARPSTELIEKYDIIQQFQRCALKTVMNLQRPGEHASCGKPLEQESGFTYRPETFMEAGIYYYNFRWKDYGVASLTTILDMVKVMLFAIQEGKMAVHCHAGLGRTGVLMACYLVFTTRMNADQAILYVRAKRPNSIQTRGQLLCVRQFAQFLVPLRSVFSCAEPKTSAVTLSQYLIRQRHLLHGYEARQMKNVPKIVHLVCMLLLNIATNRQVVINEQRLEIPDLTAEVEKTVSQQALQQLGKEMIGKGIPVLPSLMHMLRPPSVHWDQPLISDNELDPLWRQQNLESSLKSSLSNNRSLSDPLLHKYGQLQYQEGNLRNTNSALSHSNPTVCDFPRSWYFHPQDILSSIQNLKVDANPGIRCSTFQKSLHKRQHNLTLDLSEHGKKTLCNATLPSMVLMSSEKCMDGEMDRGDATELTCTARHCVPSSESRRVLVAKALAMDLKDMVLSSKVSWWQMELNSREGAWERLCTEKDPLILSCLMWSWLEQLKDPIITQEDVETLSEKNINLQSVLNSLDKCPGLTLLCILDCAAHLLPVPDEVVTMFLQQTIKVFTKTDPASDKNASLYRTLKSILTLLQYELREQAPDQSGQDTRVHPSLSEP